MIAGPFLIFATVKLKGPNKPLNHKKNDYNLNTPQDADKLDFFDLYLSRAQGVVVVSGAVVGLSQVKKEHEQIFPLSPFFFCLFICVPQKHCFLSSDEHFSPYF